MRFALLLGRTLRELDGSMGADEWEGCWLPWLAEYDLPDAFFVAGRVCPTVAGVHGNDVGPDDFVPFYGRPARAQTPEEMAARFRHARELVASSRGAATPRTRP